MFQTQRFKKVFETGSISGIQPVHAHKLSKILTRLNVINAIDEMDLPGFRLHPLKGELKGLWAVTVQANWRITFKLEDENVYIVDYQDYH
ncbi:MAG: type II toxin-antitoxin system RelE/ParE family toxin [Heliobacteriaceae bacterium]|nr:type II toxin-antitoxin system RelE/ParE family toxin [Heliobacteriaceae bacterium]